MKFKIVYDVTKFEEDIVEAESLDEAENVWLDRGIDGRLYYIEDEDGDRVYFD